MVERLAPLARAHALPAGTAGGPALSIVERRGLGFLQVGAYDAASVRVCAAALSEVARAPVDDAPGGSTLGETLTVLWGGLRRFAIAGPGEILTELAPRLTDMLEGRAQVVDLGHARVPFRLSGAGARTLLAKGAILDFHAAAFPVGRVAHTSLAHLAALVHLRDATPTFDIWVHRSTVVDFHEWLEVASREMDRIYAVAAA
jgi:heterotetrameric sarcosine oxidase gamma subunit